jgi:hypothetical protein
MTTTNETAASARSARGGAMTRDKGDGVYNAICAKLGARNDIGFVEVTTRGTITATCGKPDEWRWLLNRCRETGLKPAKSLVERVATL